LTKEDLIKLHRKVLSHLLTLSPEEAFSTLEIAEDMFKERLSGEVLEVGLMFLSLLRRDLNYLQI